MFIFNRACQSLPLNQVAFKRQVNKLKAGNVFTSQKLTEVLSQMKPLALKGVSTIINA